MSPAAKRESVSLADIQTHMKLLYYGRPKSGKTTDAASIAKSEGVARVEYIEVESGLKPQPLINHFAVPVAKINVNRETDDEAIEDLISTLNADVPDAVVVDSATELHKKLLEELAGFKRSRDLAAGKVRDKYSVEVGDYGDNTTQMRRFFRAFRDLPCHTIFVALEKRDQDKQTGEVGYGPDLTPKLASDLLGYVDVICHTTVEGVAGRAEPNYWGTFRALDLYEGGDRFHMLPPRLINPSADRILAYIDGELTLDDDDDMQREFARIGVDPSDAEEALASITASASTPEGAAPPPLTKAKR